MRNTLALPALLILLTAATTRGQDDGLEFRTFDAYSVFRGQAEFSLEIGLPLADAYREGSGVEPMEEPREGLSVDRLADLIRQCVAPDSWEAEGVFLELDGDRLYVRNHPEVLRQIETFITGLGRSFGRKFSVDVYRLIGANAEGAAGVHDAQTTSRLLGQSTPGLAGRLELRSGTTARLVSGREISFVADFDVEVAKQSTIADPVIRVIEDGLDLRVGVYGADDRGAVLRVAVRESDAPRLTEVETAAPGRVHLPDIRTSLATASGVVPQGGSLVVATRHGDRAMVLLLRVTGEDVPASQDPGFALLPVGGLTSPRLAAEVTRTGRPTRSAGDEIDMDCDEPSAAIEMDRLVDLTRHLSGPAWDEDEHAFLAPMDDFIIARAEPDVVSAARQVVRRLHADLMVNLALEFRAGWLDAASAASVARDQVDPGALAQLLPISARTSSLSGEGFRITMGTERGYVRDYDVEIAESSIAFDPIVATVFDGIALAGRATAMNDGRIGLRAVLAMQELTGLGTTPLPAQGEGPSGKVQVPQLQVTDRSAHDVIAANAWSILFLAAVDGHDGPLVVLVRAHP